MHDTSEKKIKQIKESCHNMKYLITYDLELSILIPAADVSITDHSNAGIEAILLDKPLITTNFAKEQLTNVQRYHEYDAAIYAEDYSKLEKILLEILIEGKHLQRLKEGRKRAIDSYNFYNDGKASERIFNLLLQKNVDKQ